LGKVGEARKALQKSSKLDRTYPFPVFELGGLFWNQGNRRKAIFVWKNALKKFPLFERSGEVASIISEYEIDRGLRK
jgi:hypothetical protein